MKMDNESWFMLGIILFSFILIFTGVMIYAGLGPALITLGAILFVIAALWLNK